MRNVLFWNTQIGTWLSTTLLSYAGLVIVLAYFGIVDDDAIPWFGLIPVSYGIGLVSAVLLGYFFWRHVSIAAWKRVAVILGSILLLPGHLGPVGLTYVMLSLHDLSGEGASGLMLLYPAALTVVFYGLGWLLLIIGLIQEWWSTAHRTPNHSLQQSAASGSR